MRITDLAATELFVPDLPGFTDPCQQFAYRVAVLEELLETEYEPSLRQQLVKRLVTTHLPMTADGVHSKELGTSRTGKVSSNPPSTLGAPLSRDRDVPWWLV